ncbi:hypothetical protein [Nocardioides antri]|uniref:Peptidase MA-like domain-containing protein n=1 Tax=Nocardioides antri TaxID=2607659 RepID=A0A5B1MAR7_9ACTN|nr:hypothetical protein [Nocardioides antri]KAA1429099.1 hypothetical protein F0U47_02545 [Nocardioides antri]
MSTGADRSRSRIVPALLLAALLAGVLAACGDDSPAPSSDPEAEVVAGIERTLRQRARALVAHDEAGFDRTIRARDPEFVAEQTTYFDNLGQLPLEMLRFDLAADTVERDGKAYWAEITVRLQLQGYDATPVVTRDRWRFAPTRNERRYLLTSTTDTAWEKKTSGAQPQPWDLGEVEVREGPGVLGIFDATTVATAEAVVASVSEGRFQVKAVLPGDIGDPGGVVVYTLADPTYVESLDSLPVSDPDRLDAVTLPVPRNAADAGGPVASYRILLGPHVLDEDGEVLDRLVRHELTHVALGDHARGVPMWLTEGLAEYVSVRPIAPAERRLQTEALNLVASGVDDLPADEAFGGEDAEGWYALSWWVCEYIAATYGEPALWELLDGLANGADQDEVIGDQLGVSTADLLQGGADLMRRTYG